MAITLEELLGQIPSDSVERVSRTKERYNQRVREILRQETGFRFNRSAEEEPTQVRITLAPGLPEKLRNRRLPEEVTLAALLAPWRHTLEELRDSSALTREKIVPSIAALLAGAQLVGDLPSHLHGAYMLAEALLKEAQKFNFVKWLMDVNEDVLGVYRYSARRPRHANAPQEGEIELYWAVVALVSRVLGCASEDMTVVVLAHELAHAYTHLGFDIDGERWKHLDFSLTERGLKEGLAQYYTARVCNALDRLEPQFKKAYELLLPHQPTAYQTHTSWVENQKPEEIRLAMIETRRKGTGTLEAFNAALASAQGKLRKPVPAPAHNAERLLFEARPDPT